jgi:hypothetical protein
MGVEREGRRTGQPCCVVGMNRRIPTIVGLLLGFAVAAFAIDQGSPEFFTPQHIERFRYDDPF